MITAFDWKDFLQLAKGLEAEPETPGPADAALRAAASRAYYAAFHDALAFARSEGYEPSGTGDDHQLVQAYFRDARPADKARGEIAVNLSRLLTKRHLADYQCAIRVSATVLASEANQLAASIIGDLGILTPRRRP